MADVICHLFHVYGRVKPQQEQKVQQMVYDPQHPIDRVFTAVDDLINFAEAAQSPYTQQAQCVNLAYCIVNRTGMFQRWILDWNTRPQVQKTRMNFKLHFYQAHQQLKDTTNLQVQDSIYHANAVQELLQEIRSEIQMAKHSTPTQQGIPPSLTSVGDNSIDLSISALQSEVSSLKEYTSNMHHQQFTHQ